MAYKMTHPETSDQIEVRADMVAMYESQGWEKSPNAKEPEASAGKPAKD